MARTLQVMPHIRLNRNRCRLVTQAAADAVASVRAEGLEPGRRGGARSPRGRKGTCPIEQLEEARLRLLNEPSLTAAELLSRARAA